jgi:hypothetical protein
VSDPQHEPLGGRNFYSNEKANWFMGEPRPGLTRCEAIANVLTSTLRPTDPTRTLWNSVYTKMKFHDKEPELVVEELEKRWPGFFVGLPTRTGPTRTPTLDQKKEIIGEWAKSHIRLGLSAYGKPGLRKTSTRDDILPPDLRPIS